VSKPFGVMRHVLAARVVDQRVDAVVPLQHPVDERRNLVLLADVADHRFADAVTHPGGFVQRLEPATCDHDGRAERAQFLGGRASEPRSAPRYDDHLPL
jgi:hypothetical protein